MMILRRIPMNVRYFLLLIFIGLHSGFIFSARIINNTGYPIRQTVADNGLFYKINPEEYGNFFRALDTFSNVTGSESLSNIARPFVAKKVSPSFKVNEEKELDAGLWLVNLGIFSVVTGQSLGAKSRAAEKLSNYFMSSGDGLFYLTNFDNRKVISIEKDAAGTPYLKLIYSTASDPNEPQTTSTATTPEPASPTGTIEEQLEAKYSTLQKIKESKILDTSNLKSPFADQFLINNAYRDILGISPTASIEEIRKAYRDALVKFHPDKFGTNQELQNKANEITQAVIAAREYFIR